MFSIKNIPWAALAFSAFSMGCSASNSTEGSPPTPSISASAQVAQPGLKTSSSGALAPPAPSNSNALPGSPALGPGPAQAPPSNEIGAQDAGADAAAENAEPIPDVKVVNIGMHVGGGKNDAPEKEPIKKSVEPHFDAFKRCFAKVSDQGKGGDFGVDLRIEKEGGKAKVSHPRTSLKGEGFEACVLAVFEQIDFRKPKGGTTVVSYSLRFTPRSK